MKFLVTCLNQDQVKLGKVKWVYSTKSLLVKKKIKS